MVDGSGPAAERLDLRAMLRLHEGLRLKPYEDTEGNLTIGFGHLVAKGITRERAEDILTDDIGEATADLHARWPWMQALDPVRHDVMVMLCFNMGGRVLSTFKATLELVRTGDYTEASRQMLKSKWARQVGQRANTLSEMMASGEWPVA